MKFTLSWLKEYLETNATLEELTDKLTDIGLEVEKADSEKKQFIISKIVDIQPHTNADNLNICMVDNGEEILQIICGANNLKINMNVVLAVVGSTIPSSGFVIKKARIRNVLSHGMLCSARDLGIGDDHDGIIDIVDDITVGSNFFTNDPVIEIAITPNRGDCLGVRGIARDLAATDIGILKPLVFQDINFKTIESPIQVNIDKASECSYFAGVYIQGLNNNSSPDWMQERLKAVGIMPKSAIIDITNYLTIALNQPMHVYDADKISGDLTIRLAKKGERFKALNGIDYELSDDITVISDDRCIQGLGGIIGSIESSCSNTTSNVFLEIAMFDQISIALKSRKLDITTDASYRFQRGLDSEFTADSTKIAINMITSICGGEAYVPCVRTNRQDKAQEIITFDLQKLIQITGCNIDEANSKNILRKLGFTFHEQTVLRPSWRHDIDGEADIAEEILRIDGYNHISETPLPDIIQQNSAKIKTSSLNCDLLIARGMHEVITWSFMDSSKVINNVDLIKIKNPIRNNLDVMRPSVIPNLFEIMLNNFARDKFGIAIFEIGPIYSHTQSKLTITGLRSGVTSKKNIYGTDREYDLFDVKADVLKVLEQYNIDSPQLTRNTPKYYHCARSGCFMLGKTVLAYFGELVDRHKHRVVGFEIFIDDIPDIKKKEKSQNLSIYQAVNRDFAFVIKKDIPADQIIRIIKASDKAIIKAIDIFDIYHGHDIGKDNKSIAISVTLQSVHKTLTYDDIDEVHTRIIQNVKNKANGILRKDYHN